MSSSASPETTSGSMAGKMSPSTPGRGGPSGGLPDGLPEILFRYVRSCTNSLSTHLSGQNCPWHRKKILKYTTYSRDFLPCQRQFSLVSPHTLANGTASKSLFHISKYAGWRKIFPPDQANFRRNTGCISRKFNAVWRQKARQPAC